MHTAQISQDNQGACPSIQVNGLLFYSFLFLPLSYNRNSFGIVAIASMGMLYICFHLCRLEIFGEATIIPILRVGSFSYWIISQILKPSKYDNLLKLHLFCGFLAYSLLV